MDRYFLAKTVPPPNEAAVLIKHGKTVEQWRNGHWDSSNDPMKYLMGDYEVNEVSLQEAEEHMRGIAPKL
jgi:hypothetical protein